MFLCFGWHNRGGPFRIGHVSLVMSAKKRHEPSLLICSPHPVTGCPKGYGRFARIKVVLEYLKLLGRRNPKTNVHHQKIGVLYNFQILYFLVFGDFYFTGHIVIIYTGSPRMNDGRSYIKTCFEVVGYFRQRPMCTIFFLPGKEHYM